MPQASSLVYELRAMFAAASRAEARRHSGNHTMATLAMTMFVALFAFGGQYFGWTDPVGRVQLALFSAFVFGIICGYRVKG